MSFHFYIAMPSHDPYQLFLEIPPDVRPLDHYRLLGIERFESSPQIINGAVQRCVQQIRQRATEANKSHAQQLLNELKGARNCLLDQSAKAAYDSALKNQKLDRDSSSAPVAVPVAAPVADAGAETTTAVPVAAPVAAAVPATETIQLAKVSPAASAIVPQIPAVPASPAGTSPPSAVHLSEAKRPFYLRASFGAVATALVVVIVGIAWAILNGLPKNNGNQQASVESGVAVAQDTTPVEVPDQRPPDVQPADAAGEPAPNDTVRPAAIPVPRTKTTVVSQEGDGSINLPASVATIHGSSLQLSEHMGASVVVTGWSGADDWLSWQFNVILAGDFQAEVMYWAPSSSAAGQYELVVNNDSYQHAVSPSQPEGQLVTDRIDVQIKRPGRSRLTLRSLESGDSQLFSFYLIRLVHK